MKTLIYALSSVLILLLISTFWPTKKESEKQVNNQQIYVSPSKDEIINVSQIAKKTPDQIEKMFGKPTFTDNITPSGAPCPCVKKIYLNGDIEIVFINDKADWITINKSPNYIEKGGLTQYVSYDSFDDYTYIKTSTN
jgi:hypothetical protein